MTQSLLLMRATVADFAWPIILLWNPLDRFIIIYNNTLYNIVLLARNIIIYVII